MSRSSRLQCSRQVLSSLAALGLLAGCGARTQVEPVSLATLADRTLRYALVDMDSLERPEAPDAHRFSLTFSQPEEGCTRLAEGVVATFNGQRMGLEPGGLADTEGGEACQPIRALLDFDPALWEQEPVEDLRAILQAPDGSQAVTLVLRDAKAKRRFLFQGDGNGTTLRRGQTYTYLWLPEEETPGPVTVTLQREGEQAGVTLAVMQQGQLVRFTLPESTPAAHHLLRLRAGTPGDVLTCEGVAACEGELFHSEDFAVTVIP